MSFPQNSSEPSTPSSAAQRQRRVRTARWTMVLVLAGFFAVWQAPLEIGRWQLTAALNARQDGEKQAAYEHLNTVIDRFQTRPLLFLQRAEWRMEDGQRQEAIDDIDRMLELAGERLDWLMVHSQFLQNAGEFARAVEDWKKVNDFSKRSGRPDRGEALNGLAYAQALANQELDDALNNANEALELRPESHAHILDTRGFIYHRMGKNILALSDLNSAIGALGSVPASLRPTNSKKARPASAFELLTDSVPKTWREVFPGGVTPEREMAQRVRTVAVIHYHRALILDALDRKDEAEKDKAVIRRLIGRDGDETLF
jgi:tetratricopeptide (TPR) repeat protein